MDDLINQQVIELTRETFSEKIKTGKVVVDFWASWCGPCRMQMPVIETLAASAKDVVFAKVNVDEERDLAHQYQVMSIPTLLLFEEGVLKKKLVGFQNEAALRGELA